MGLCKLVDALLFLYFLFITIASVLIDAQTSIPSQFFPETLIELKSWYAREFGDYLVSEKPHFFVGLINVELIVQFPVAIATLYGILARKSWVRTTCLIYGVSTLSTMIWIPARFIPDSLVELTTWFSREFDHYLIVEKPNFYAGAKWVVLIVHWPAALASVYGFISKKSWINTTCLIYEVSMLSCLIVILTELIKSKRASEKMFMVYWPFLGVAVLAVLRGLVPCSGGGGSAASARRSAAPRKKRA